MRAARLGLFVSLSILTVGLGTTSITTTSPPAAAAADSLRIVESGEGDAIFATFDRPMIEPEQIGSPAPLEVDLPGTSVWNTLSTAVFRREGALPPSRTVHVRVPGAAALDGIRLPAPVSWSFRTPGLAAEGSLPSVTGPCPRFDLKFNRPVDPAEFARHVTIENGERRRVAVRCSGFTVEVPSALPYDSSWTLSVSDRLRATDGAGLEQPVSHRFSVCPAPGLRSSNGTASVNASNEITLRFTTPMSGKDLRARLTIKPEVEFSLSAWREEVTLSGPFAPSASYWIQIAPGAEDDYRNPLPPITTTVQIPAYPASLRFPERNLYVERQASGAVPLETVNVPQARLVVRRLAPEPWTIGDGELLVDRRFDANQEPNEIYTHGVPLPGPGRYALEATAGELKLRDTATYQVTDLALTFKLGRDRSLACVTSLHAARPVWGAEVSLHDGKGGELWKGVTAEDGCVEAPGQTDLARVPEYFLARAAEDVASLRLANHELSTWRLPVEHVRTDRDEPLDLYLVTDRPLYRGGDAVHAKGWWLAPKNRGVTLELHDPGGTVLHRASPTVSPAGGLDATFALSPTAPDGTYRIIARSGSRTVTREFFIGYYRAPGFEVRVRPGAPHFFPKDRLEATVEARAFFGAPLAGARVTWNTLIDGRADHAEGSGVLDAEGRFTISYPLGAATGMVAVRASVMDAANQTVTAEAFAPVHPAAVKIQARAGAALAEAGKPLAFDLSVVTLDGAPAPREVQVRLLRRTWSTVQQLTAGHGWSYTYEKHDEVVASGTASGNRWETIPAAPGPHILEARARDDAGREALASIDVDVVGAGEASWRPRNDLALELVPDRALYRAGDTARVLLRHAVVGSRALVTLEREGVRDHRWVDVAGPAPVLEVPLEAAQTPNIHLGVLLVAPRTSAAPGPDGGPLYRHGYATLKIDVSERRLPVEIRPLAPTTPGAEVDVEVATAPRAEVTLAVVDQAVLALVESADPDPHAFFWAPHPLRVDTSETRSDLAQFRVLDVRGKKGRPGGDGGGPTVRRKFVGTAYWNPCVVAGDDGRARVRFKMPDNLTRWRVVAVATTGDRWGAGHATFETRKPLMVASAFPRFALLGDSFTGRVVVHNRTGVPGRATVECDGERREVEVLDGRSAPVEFPIRTEQLGRRTFQVRATLGGHADRLEISIPVHPPGAAETDLRTGHAEGDVEIPLPAMENVQSVTLDLGLSESIFMEAELRRLLEYPHGCVEQTTSKTLPLLVLRQLRVEGADARIEAGVKRLLSMQTSSGGLGYWPGYEHPHPEGTVYATHALVLAERAGLAVPRAALDRALDFAEGRLRDPHAASRSYALFVLALAGRRHEAYLESLPADPFLALAAIELGRPDRARRILRGPVEISNRPTGIFESDLRSGAARIIARTRLGEDPGLRARDLLERALVTYDRAWTLLAMGEIVASTQESGPRRVSVEVDGKPLPTVVVDGTARVDLPAGRVRLSSDGPFYYALRIRGQRRNPPREDHGLWVRRSYRRAGEDLARTDFVTGDLVVVRVTLFSRGPRRYVALEDPLPAGFEPVDLRFRTEDRSQGTRNDLDYLEQRDDRIFASSENLKSGISEVTYLARATSAGRFTAPAPYAEEMYDPAVRGRGAAAVIEVRAR